MARPRAATYDAQREEILARAAALFAQRGYTATSMNEVAAACDVSKATLYHYVRDKHELLCQIAETHVLRLEAIVAEVTAAKAKPEQRLRHLIEAFMRAYADSSNEHRVLTEDVRFLRDEDRERVLACQRRVVAQFARAVVEVRPPLAKARLDKPLTMLLFGMINWTFTWLRADGDLSYDELSSVVADLFIGGLASIETARKGRATASA